MKRLLPPMIALTFSALSLVACGKNGGGSNPSTSKDKQAVVEYNDLVSGKYKSQKSQIEFTGNQYRERGWMEVRHATEYYENDFYLNCDIERNGTYKIVKTEEGMKLQVELKEIILHEAQPSRRGENISGFSKEKLNRLCSAVVNKFKSIDANVISSSKNHLHILKDEDYSEYDSVAGGYKVNFSEISDDYTGFFIKGEELNVTRMFGQYYEGVYLENDSSKNQLSIVLDEMSGELSYDQRSDKCSSAGQFKVFFTLKKGLEFRLDQANPCATGYELYISDFMYGKDSPGIDFRSEFGVYFTIQSRTNDPRI